MLNFLRRSTLRLAGSFIVLGLGSGLVGAPGQAAEKVIIKYGAFGRSVSVADLREYAETSKASPELASVLSIVKSEQKESLQKGLKIKLPFNAVQVDKLLRSGPGAQLLPQVAKVTILPGDSEELAMRSALVIAAGSKEGLGTLSFLEAYPTPTLTIDARAMQKLLKSNASLGALMGGELGK
ncbi:MAG: alpha/beta hydrolase [Thermosynechococcaceae cyanobacterium]